MPTMMKLALAILAAVAIAGCGTVTEDDSAQARRGPGSEVGGGAGTIPDSAGGAQGGPGGAPAAGAGGTGGAPVVADVGCTRAPAIIQANCADCHSGSSPLFGDLDLTSPGVASRLIGRAATGQCGGAGALINRGILPATGILLDKINGRQACGAMMPFGASVPLGADDLLCLQLWADAMVAGR